MENENNVKHQSIPACAEQVFEAIPEWMKRISNYYWNQVTETEWVTIGQYRILFLVSEGLTTISALAEKKNVSAPTVSRQVNSLVQKGLIFRKQDDSDRRVIVLQLTELGEKLLSKVREQTLEWLSKKISLLKEEEIQHIQKSIVLMNKVFIDPQK
ncbi:MAG: MarR family transcriptional regulator [Anaerolineaceae bacterium]|nr:MarR family transcriptional regulator [Anaerolineaceae bacterium]